MIIAFKVIVCILGLIAIVTGIPDFLHGTTAQQSLGAQLGEGFKDPAMNNTFRFFSAIWIGFGIFLILFAMDLNKYYVPLVIAFLIVVLGGIGRIMSINEFGLPVGRETTLWAIVILEVVIVPLLLAWLIWAKRAGILAN